MECFGGKTRLVKIEQFVSLISSEIFELVSMSCGTIFQTNQYLKQRDQKKLASRRKNTKASEIKKSIKRRAEEKARQRASQLRKEAEIERQNQNIIEALMENGLTSKRIVKIFERNRGKSDESCSNQITQSQRSRRDNQNKNYGTDESKESNFSDEEKGDEEYKPLDHEHKKFKKLNDAKRSSQNVIEVSGT